MEFERLCELQQQNIGRLESALINYYTTDKGLYKSSITLSNANKILKSILGIRNTQQMSIAEQAEYIEYAQDRLLRHGRIKAHCNKNMYRTA